jgi:DNA-directed RNA polymerase subunit RPC12/RpoP
MSASSRNEAKCPHCGFIAGVIPPSQDTVRCLSCGRDTLLAQWLKVIRTPEKRDENAK